MLQTYHLHGEKTKVSMQVTHKPNPILNALSYRELKQGMKLVLYANEKMKRYLYYTTKYYTLV